MAKRNRFVDMKCGWKKATDEERRQFVRWIAGEEQGGMWPGYSSSHEQIELCAVALTPEREAVVKAGRQFSKGDTAIANLAHPDGGFYVQPGDKGDRPFGRGNSAECNVCGHLLSDPTKCTECGATMRRVQ